MQAISDGYRGLNLLVQVAGDRVLVPLAILISIMLAAAVIFQSTGGNPAVTPGFF